MVTIKRDIVNSGHGYLSPYLFAVHSTANPGATARNHRDLWSRGWDYAVHLVSDWTESIQCMEFNRLAWQVGNGNGTCIGIEICEATNAADFRTGLNIAAETIAQVLKSRGWTTSVMHPHLWFSQQFGGSDHTDPRPYFAKYGWSWEQFVALVNQKMKGTTVALTQSEINKIADAVWAKALNGTAAGTRLAGIDSAANGALKVARDIRSRLFGVSEEGKDVGNANEYNWLTNRVYRLADLFFNQKPQDDILARIAAIESKLDMDSQE